MMNNFAAKIDESYEKRLSFCKNRLSFCKTRVDSLLNLLFRREAGGGAGITDDSIDLYTRVSAPIG